MAKKKGTKTLDVVGVDGGKVSFDVPVSDAPHTLSGEEIPVHTHNKPSDEIKINDEEFLSVEESRGYNKAIDDVRRSNSQKSGLNGYVLEDDTQRYVGRDGCWTTDPNKALRFHSDADAKAYNDLHCENLYKAVAA